MDSAENNPSVELPPKLRARVERVAELTGHSVEEFLREAERMPLDEFEDVLIAIERDSKPNANYLTNEEATARLGS